MFLCFFRFRPITNYSCKPLKSRPRFTGSWGRGTRSTRPSFTERWHSWKIGQWNKFFFDWAIPGLFFGFIYLIVTHTTNKETGKKEEKACFVLYHHYTENNQPPAEIQTHDLWIMRGVLNCCVTTAAAQFSGTSYFRSIISKPDRDHEMSSSVKSRLKYQFKP